MLSGRKVTADSVKNVTTFAEYLHSRHGLARPATVKDKSFDKKALDWFWENYPNGTWEDLCNLADYVFKKKQHRPKNIYALVTYNVRDAWADGVFKPRDQSQRDLDERLKDCLQDAEALDGEMKDYWTFRLSNAFGTGRVMVYNEFNQWMKENG